MKDLIIRLSLHTLTRHRKVEKWGKAAPYLWLIFFKIDGSSVIIGNDFRLQGKAEFHFAPGSHGNLGFSQANVRSSVAIPPPLGEWRTTLTPLVVPYFEQKVSGMVGAIAVLMEQNNVSYKGAEAGHQTLNEFVRHATNQALQAFDPRVVDLNDIMGSIRAFFEQQVTQFTQGIEQKITDAVKRNQTLMQNLWSLVNTDNLIGYHVWNFSHQDIEAAGTNGIHFSNEWISAAHGDWEIFGTVQVIDDQLPLPKPSEAQQPTPSRAPAFPEKGNHTQPANQVEK